MSNASTIRRQVSGTQQLTLASIASTTTTTNNFVLNNNALTGTGGGVIPLTAGVTGLYAGTGQVLHIRAAGSFTGLTAGSSTILLTLWEVPAAIIAAGGLTQGSQTGFNSIGATSAKTVTNAAGAFTFDAYLQLDASGNLNGSYTSQIDTAAITSAVVISGVTGLVGEADLNFVLSCALGTAEPAGSVVTLNEFAIDLE